MSTSPQRNRSSLAAYLLQVITLLLTANTVAVLGQVWQFAKKLLSAQAHEGIYEVLEHESELELCDEEGETAVYHKRQRVRFLHDGTIAYQDLVWGDGEIFADYKCVPGIPVDRYQEGHRWHVLISLRETKNRGDVEEIHIKRAIRNGFTQPQETFQAEINHKTRRLELSVVFPKGRKPERVSLVEQNRNRTTPLGPEHLLPLPDGRLRVRWQTEKPRLFEAYILKWEW